MFDELKGELNLSIAEASKLSVKKVTDLRRTVVAIAKATKDGAEGNMTRLDFLELKPSINAHVSSNGNNVGLKARLVLLKQESARARAAEGDTIAFHDLGFRPTIESNAWLTMNVPNKEFGYVIDFHTLMEHVH